MKALRPLALALALMVALALAGSGPQSAGAPSANAAPADQTVTYSIDAIDVQLTCGTSQAFVGNLKLDKAGYTGSITLGLSFHTTSPNNDWHDSGARLSVPFTGGQAAPITFPISSGLVPVGWNVNTWRVDAISASPDIVSNAGTAKSASLHCEPVTQTGNLKVLKSVVRNGVPAATNEKFTICIKGPSYPNGNETGACKDFTAGQELIWSGIQTGSYTVIEDPGSDWTVQLPGSKTVSANQTASATVTNTRNLGDLKVQKVVNWNGATREEGKTFTICIKGPSYPNGNESGACKDFTIGVNDNATKTWTSLGTGSYEVLETLGPGWTKSVTGSPFNVTGTCSSSCQANIVVTNTKDSPNPGKIIVRKVTEPSSDNTTEFTFTPGGGLTGGNFTLKNGQTKEFSGLAPKSGYSVAEAALDGWDLRTATCDGGNTPGNITVTAGGTVTCTFTNTRKTGNLSVQKIVDWNGQAEDPGSLSFTICIKGPSYPLGTEEGACKTFTSNGHLQTWVNLFTGSYEITEQPATGWTIPASKTVSVLGCPEACETVQVTNVKNSPTTGTIIVRKVTDPSNDTATVFSFTASGGLDPASFTLKNGETRTFSGLTPKAGYGVAETALGGWKFTGATCSDNSPVDNIDLGAGETVTCTFNNAKQAALTVIKKVVNDNGGSATPDQWMLHVKNSNNSEVGDSPKAGSVAGNSYTLDPGTYTLSESGSVTGYTASGWVCTGGTQADDKITLATGDSAVCTITNDDVAPKLTVTKTVSPSNDPGKFNLLVGGVVKASDVSDGGTTGAMVMNAGAYKVSETEGTGTKLSDYTAVIAGACDAQGNVTLLPGDDKTCTITNTKGAAIVVRKVTDPATDTTTTFPFFAGGGLTPSEFTLKNGESKTFAVAPGSGYNVGEGETAGWELTSIVCSDESSPTDINVSPGEVVTCTFTNKAPQTPVPTTPVPTTPVPTTPVPRDPETASLCYKDSSDNWHFASGVVKNSDQWNRYVSNEYRIANSASQCPSNQPPSTPPPAPTQPPASTPVPAVAAATPPPPPAPTATPEPVVAPVSLPEIVPAPPAPPSVMGEQPGPIPERLPNTGDAEDGSGLAILWMGASLLLIAAGMVLSARLRLASMKAKK